LTTNSNKPAERIDHLACELDGFDHANRIHHQIRQFLTRLEDVPQRRRLKMALPKHSAWDAPIAIT
jgi:hypothetical protein